MNTYHDYDRVALQREAERLRAKAIRDLTVALARKIAAFFGGNRKPHGGVAAGA